MGNLSRAELRNINKTRGLRLSLFSFSETDDAFAPNKPSVCPKRMVCFPLTDGSFCLGKSCFALAILSFSFAIPRGYKKEEKLSLLPYTVYAPNLNQDYGYKYTTLKRRSQVSGRFFTIFSKRISYSPGAIYEP